MNGKFVKRGAQSFLAMFFLVFGLLLTANRAEAQQSTLSPNNINWQTSNEAITTLESHISGINNDLIVTQPGPAFDALMREAIFYKAIYSNISFGMSVPDAIGGVATGMKSDGSEVNFTKQQLLVLLEEARALLSN